MDSGSKGRAICAIFQYGLFYLVCLSSAAAILAVLLFLVGSRSLFMAGNLNMLAGWVRLAAASGLCLLAAYYFSLILGAFFRLKPSVPAMLVSLPAGLICLVLLYAFSALKFILGGLE